MSDQQNQTSGEAAPLGLSTDAQPVQPAPETPAATPAQEAAPAADAPVGETAVPEAEHEPWPGLPPEEPSKTVILTEEVYAPFKDPKQELDYTRESVILPSDTLARTEQYHEERPNDLDANNEDDANWARQMELAEMVRPRGNRFADSVEREGSSWTQGVQSEIGLLAAARPRVKDPADGVVSGARAVQRIRAIVGLGSILQVPMWHSGFWMTFRAPSDGEILELHRRISDAKVTLGRQTYGLVFANTSAYVAAELVQFALDHLHDTTLKAGVDIRKHLKVHDLQAIAWGLACVIYTRGFQYSRPVLTGEGKEKREVKGLLNVGKMFFVDNSQLTPWQISHMSKRAGNSMTEEMLERYQAEFVGHERQVELTSGVKMTMKVPSVDEYLNSGHRWVEGITEMVDQAFQQPPAAEVRDRYISQQGRATSMRQFAHWVKSVDEDVDSGMSYDKPETIEELLNTLSEMDDVRKNYFEAIHKFTDDTTISVVATHSVSDEEENKLPRFPHLVPIDALYTFFILLVQKTERINLRQDL